MTINKFNHKGIEGSHYRNEQYLFKFENGFGASVVRGDTTYGGSDGLWELAVLDGTGGIDYTTEITDDVVGCLSELEVEVLLDRIKNLAK